MTPSIPNSNEVSTHEVIRGETIKLECPAIGKPAPKITWYRDGDVVGELLLLKILMSRVKKASREIIEFSSFEQVNLEGLENSKTTLS